MKTKLVMSMMFIAVAALLIGGATMAWFTDSAESTPVTFGAGTLLIDLDVDYDKEYLAEEIGVNVDNLNPGDEFEWDITVSNNGTKKFDWGIYVFWNDIIGQLNEDLDEINPDMRNILVTKEYGTDKLSQVIEFEVYRNEVKIDQFSGTLKDKMGPLAAYMPETFMPTDDDVVFTIKAKLPTSAGNEYQGSKMELVFGVMAWQATNDAPAPTLADLKNPFGGSGQIDPPAVVEGAEINVDSISFGNSGSMSNGTTTIGGNIGIVGAKDGNGDLLNGEYNVVFGMQDFIGTKTVMVDFNAGNASFNISSWSLTNNTGTILPFGPNQIVITFGPQ